MTSALGAGTTGPGSADEVQADDRQAFLESVVASTLQPVAGGLAVLFLVIAAVQRFAMAPPFPGVMAPYSVAMSLVFAGIYAGIRSRGLPPRWAHPVGTGFVLLVLVGTVLPFALIQDPLQTTDLVILAMGVGAVFVSTRWYALNVAILVAVFGAFVALEPGYARWPNLGVAVTSGAVLGYVVLRHRADVLTSLHDLRAQDARQREELEDRMARIEELRDRAEQERDRAQRYAVQLEDTNQDLHRFARTLSRHLSAPVSRARQALEAAGEGGANGSVVAARREIAGLEATLEALLDYAAVATHETDLEPVSARERVLAAWQDVVADLDVDAREPEVGELPEVVADGDLLERLFRELFENALIHGEPPVSVAARREGGAVRVVVEDSGPGIHPDRRSQVFRLLVGEEGDRPGMGLAICRRIAERLGGDVDVDPGGDGARFVVTLRAVDRIGAPLGGERAPDYDAPDRGSINRVGDGAQA